MRVAMQSKNMRRLRPMLIVVLAVFLGAPANSCLAGPVAMSRGVEDLYSSVSIYPPSATGMTVCYGFVCRRRYALDFGAGDRAALTAIMNAGHASAAAERAALRRA